MYTKLREDNTATNCTVESDPYPKTGRDHYWHWDKRDTRGVARVCSTCGRVEDNVRDSAKKYLKPLIESAR